MNAKSTLIVKGLLGNLETGKPCVLMPIHLEDRAWRSRFKMLSCFFLLVVTLVGCMGKQSLYDLFQI